MNWAWKKFNNFRTWLKLILYLLSGGRWYGVDVLNEDIADNFEAFVWEPAVVKINALTAASEATCLILSVDETIRNPKSNAEGGGGMGRGRGRPMWNLGVIIYLKNSSNHTVHK